MTRGVPSVGSSRRRWRRALVVGRGAGGGLRAGALLGLCAALKLLPAVLLAVPLVLGPRRRVAYVQWWVTYDGPLFDGVIASNALSMTAP